MRWCAILGAFLMVLEAFTGVAHAGSAPANNNSLWITDLSTTSPGNVVRIGQPVHFIGHITGGILCNKNAYPNNCQQGVLNNPLTTWGYHLFWFFGKVNGTGNESNVTAFKQNYQVPNCDNTATTVCSVNTTIQAVTTYSYPGTYVVSLTAYDANFDYDIDTVEVVVVPPSFHVHINSVQPLANLSGKPAMDEGVPLLFNGSCQGNCSGVVLQWKFGDGTTGYGHLVAHSYTESGEHVVTLTGIDNSAGAQNQSFTTVDIGDTTPFFYPHVGPWYDQRDIGIYSPYNFTNLTQNFTTYTGASLGFCAVGYDWNNADGQGMTFRWSFGDGATQYTRVTPTSQLPQGYLQRTCDDPNVTLIPNALGNQTLFTVPNPAIIDEAVAHYSLASHSYTCPGWYNVTVTVFNEGLLNVTFNHTISVHVVNLATPPGGWAVPVFKSPVGQMALLNASQSLSLPSPLLGFPTTLSPPTTAFYNYTWSAGGLGTSYGHLGRVTSFTPVNQSVTLTTVANTTALPCASSTPTSGSSYVDFYDVKPTVGIDSLYTQATITLTVENPDAYNFLNFTLYENGKEWGYYNMSYYVDYNTVTLAPLQFQMSDRWTIGLQYTPYGSRGGSYVDVQFAWKGDDSAIDGYDSTESDAASDTVSAFFSDSNTTAENHLNFSLNAQALGEPLFGSVVFFSPAQTHLAETWSWGDGTYSYTNTSKPSTPEPTLDTWLFEAAYDVGSNYTLKVTACDPLGYCGSDQILIDSYYNLTANDTAPTVYLPHASGFSPTTVEDAINAYNATVVNQDNASGPATVTWQYGDDTNSTNTTTGGNVTTSHVYQYGAQYALVVYAKSPGGSTTVNWTFVNVSNPAPRANFTVSPSAPFVGGVTTFSGVNSSDVNGNPSGLSFGWVFGNGFSTGALGDPGANAVTSFRSSGTYTATLVVQDEEGSTVSVSHTVTVATATPIAPFPTVTPSNATADTFSSFAVSIPSTSIFSEIPLVNVTWSWGDGSGPSWGLTTGHTFLYPGDYTVNATLSAPGISSPYTASATVRVVDGTPTISLPYEGDEEYGGNHTASFTAVILGDYADQGKSWNVTWNLGDGNFTSTAGGNVSTASHVYIQEGLLTVRVNASGPYPKFGAPNATAQFSLESVPDFDNDGLPNAYETLVTHTSNAYADSTDKTGLSAQTVKRRVALATQEVVADLPAATAFFDRAILDGCEGVMAKSLAPGSRYRAGARGFWWIKYKREYTHTIGDSIDGVVVGAFFGRGRRAGTYGALLAAVYNPKEDRFESFCKVGSGFDDAMLKELPGRLAPYRTDTAPAGVATGLVPDVWMRPGLVLEIRGAELSLSPNHRAGFGRIRPGAGFALRFPRFTGRFRDDKSASEATTAEELLALYNSQVRRATPTDGERAGEEPPEPLHPKA
jgi:PKD repeat protein